LLFWVFPKIEFLLFVVLAAMRGKDNPEADSYPEQCGFAKSPNRSQRQVWERYSIRALTYGESKR
jgi:hypothetical protein